MCIQNQDEEDSKSTKIFYNTCIQNQDEDEDDSKSKVCWLQVYNQCLSTVIVLSSAKSLKSIVYPLSKVGWKYSQHISNYYMFGIGCKCNQIYKLITIKLQPPRLILRYNHTTMNIYIILTNMQMQAHNLTHSKLKFWNFQTQKP